MKVAALILAFLLPLTSFAAITAGTPSDGKSGSSPLTYSYTVNGPNAAIIVQARGPTSDLCTGATWNGNTLTLLGKNLNGREDYMWGAKVSAGTGNVVITCPGTDLIISNVEEYDNVGTFVLSGTVKTSGTATTFNQSTTTIADNSWVVWSVTAGAGTIAAGSGTTLRHETVADPNVAILDSGGPVTPAGSKTLNASASSGTWDGIIAILAPAATTVATPILGLVKSFWIN